VVLPLLFVTFAGLVVGRAALALDACTAADVESQDFGCVATSSICRVTQSFNVGDGCELDFRARPLHVAGSGRLIVGRGAMTIKSASLRIENGGAIDARGTRAAPNNRGGVVRIETTGGVEVLGPRGTIDAVGSNNGGAIIVEAGGSLTVGGRLIADATLGSATGGSVMIRSDGDFVSTAQSTITSTGPLGGAGGSISIVVRGRIDLGTVVDLSGGCAGSLDLYSGGETVVRGIRMRGTGNAGSGGCLTIFAGTTLRSLALIDVNGTGGTFGGGCGGFSCLESLGGDVVIEADIRAEGGAPDGGGGLLALIAPGVISTRAGTTISVRGNGTGGCGGELCVDAGTDLNGLAAFDASGGSAGGDVDITAGRNATLTSGVAANGRTTGGFAGTALLEAGAGGSGALTVAGAIDVGAAGCSATLGCGVGGFTQLQGCDVVVTGGGVSGRAPEAGQIELVAREQLRINASIDATSSAPAQGAPGSIFLSFPSRKQPVVSGAIQPPPTMAPMETCTMARQLSCLVPCPVCGNGQVEFPESCDDGGGVAVSCDGCSIFCRLEDCDDGKTCTIDSCDPAIGCSYVPRDLPPTPCFEPSERSPTPTPSETATGTPPPPGTPSLPTPTDTPSPEPTTTLPATCNGDCDEDGMVTVHELVLGVNLMQNGGVDACPSLDANGDGTVHVDELLTAVGFALNGCPTRDL
jgi:cysteine-rich repeat protein